MALLQILPLRAKYDSAYTTQNTTLVDSALGGFVSAFGFTFEPGATAVSDLSFFFVLFKCTVIVVFLFIPLHHAAGSKTAPETFKKFCL